MAVITTMMENTPINTPSSVSAERSLCAASAFMAIAKLSRTSASSRAPWPCFWATVLMGWFGMTNDE
jgi:hypothetical protein